MGKVADREQICVAADQLLVQFVVQLKIPAIK